MSVFYHFHQHNEVLHSNTVYQNLLKNRTGTKSTSKNEHFLASWRILKLLKDKVKNGEHGSIFHAKLTVMKNLQSYCKEYVFIQNWDFYFFSNSLVYWYKRDFTKKSLFSNIFMYWPDLINENSGFTGAVVWGCSVKKVFLEISQNP